MILLSSLVVMGGKEGSRMSMLEWGSEWRELAVMLLVTSSMFSCMVKIFVILIVLEDFLPVRPKDFFCVGCVVDFVVVMVFDV